MTEIRVRASKIDRATLGEPGPLLVGTMAVGFRHSGDGRSLEWPTFRSVRQRGIWGDDVIYRFARLYTDGIYPWR